MKTWSRRGWILCWAIWLLILIGFYAFLLIYGQGRVSEETMAHVWRNGIEVISVTLLFGLIYIFWGRHIEAWAARKKEKLTGTIWGSDVGKIFKNKD